jgi:hypothetical protein
LPFPLPILAYSHLGSLENEEPGMRRTFLLGLTLVVLAGLSLPGCQHKAAETPLVTVEGKVLYKGNGVPWLLVSFYRQDQIADRIYKTGTDAQGAFSIQCAGGGTYRVSLSPLPISTQGGPAAEEGGLARLPGAIEKKDEATLPTKYQAPDTSGLQVKVPEGGITGVEFEVKDK